MPSGLGRNSGVRAFGPTGFGRLWAILSPSLSPLLTWTLALLPGVLVRRGLAESERPILKRAAKKTMRPFTSRLFAWTDQRDAERLAAHAAGIEARLAAQDAHIARFDGDLAAFSRYLPTVINTIASQNASARDYERRFHQDHEDLQSLKATIHTLSDGLVYLERRNEFIRQEVLFEQRYGSRPSGQQETVHTEVLDKEKLEEMKDEIRLNIGAGHIPMEGYLNVDFRPLPDIDIVADIKDLPFDPEEVTEIFSSHVLEHFPVEELRRSVLPTWVSLLKDGGTFVAVVPDIASMVKEVAADRMPFEQFIGVVYGGQEYEGDFHFAGYSQESLVQLLEEAGLSEVKVREFGRPNGDCLEMEVEGTRRLDSFD